MHNQRIILRPAFGFKNFRHRVSVIGVGGKAVDRFGRNRDDLARAKQFAGFFDCFCIQFMFTRKGGQHFRFHFCLSFWKILLSDQRANGKIADHDGAEHDAVPAEHFEVVLFDIAH